jgi:hypothetical protein
METEIKNNWLEFWDFFDKKLYLKIVNAKKIKQQ